MFTEILLVAATALGAIIDVRIRRIPNALTAALAVIALGVQATHGLAAVLLAVLTGLATFALGAVVFRLGWFGGGDVKLLSAACCLVSYPDCIALIVAVLATGSALALATAALQGRLGELLRSTAAVALHGTPTARITLPYGVAIAGGSVIYSLYALVPALRFAR